MPQARNDRIALFELNSSVPSLMIAAVTQSSVTHCAVEYSGQWYDASEHRGDFNKLNPADYHNRNCYMINNIKIGDNFLPHLEGKEYDFAGVGTWLLSRLIGKSVAGADKPYCFEAGYLALTGKMPTTAVSGKDLLKIADQQHRAVYYGKFGKLNK